MALVLKDRVVESSASSGTGTFVLDGAQTGYQSFAAIGNGNTTYYTIEHPQTSEWEVGVGTYNANTLSRDTVLDSSNGGALVYFSIGQKNVFVDLPAEKVSPTDTLGTMAYQNANDVAVTGGSINGTSIGATTASTGRFSDLTDTGLTSGRVTYASTGGNLVDSANLTFNGTTLVANDITDSSLTSGRVVYAGTGGNLINSANLTFNGTTLTTNAVVTPSVTAPTTDLTLSAISTGAVKLSTAGGEQVRIINSASATNYVQLNGSSSAVAQVGVGGSSANILLQMTSKGTSGIEFKTSNFTNTQALIAHTASAVNYVQVTGAATGGRTIVSAQGSDTNIGMSYSAKGTGISVFNNGNGTQFVLQSGPASSVNRLEITPSATGSAPILSVGGTDTNISMAFQPKGTGAINLAAGSSGVNISNGGTVTAITRTAVGTSYTGVPSVAISAPTTAGGVQATATVNMGVSTFAVASGGTGYTVGNVLTVVGGTGTAATVTVSTVSAGVVTAVTYAGGGLYTATPTNPASTTGGTGTGCTLNITYTLGSTFVITNAGSGYIEQPTVTFSGGGGSGAAALAVVGSFTVFKGLGTTAQFQTYGGDVLRLGNSNGVNANYWQLSAGVAGAAVGLQPNGSDANITPFINSKGTSAIVFATNSGAQQQLLVAHTASAVNYVQVTGNATGGAPVISAQGSDSNINLGFSAKGTGVFTFTANGGEQFRVQNTASAVNNLQVYGSTAGNGPVIASRGTDTNINIALLPKGTGRVQFGTYTGTILTPTGFIEIVDAGGTIRRLLVG